MDIHRSFTSRKRKQVRRACLNCQKAHSGCGEQRPCPRCVKRKEEHKCIDAPRRKRKDQPLEASPPPSLTGQKRRRKLIDDAVHTSFKSDPRSSPSSDDSHDEDYEDEDDCCSPSASPQRHYPTPAALVSRPTKRARRHNKLHQPAPSYTSDSLLSFPFSMKTEKKEEPEEEEERGYIASPQYNGYGVMGQRQQHALSQKLPLYNLAIPQQQQQQQPQQTHYHNHNQYNNNNHNQYNNNSHNTPRSHKEDTFIFNAQEFDCVVPTERHFPCEPSKLDDDLSLEWLVPELHLSTTTTTTTTTSSSSFANPYIWSSPVEAQQSALPTSFLLDENLMGNWTTDDTPLFYSDYRTFEPLFSF